MKNNFFIFIFIFILFISGCDIGKINPPVEPDNDETIDDVIIEPTPYPLYVGGVEIEASPNRVVSLSPSITEIICELGYANRIIGKGTYCDFPPTIRSVTDAGSSANPDVDMIISLSPSLVISTAPLSGKDIFRMEQEGIKTLIIPAASDLGGLRDVYRALGLVFEGMFTGAEKGEEAFSDISKACNNTNVVNIGKFVYITKDFKAATGDTLESAIFSCFGINLAENGIDYEFDLELLYENQPNVILLNDRYTVDTLIQSEYFKGLDAVNENRIIYIDNAYFERPSVRLTQMLKQMLADFSMF